VLEGLRVTRPVLVSGWETVIMVSCQYGSQSACALR
jgi:hypothetical protein